MSLKQKLVAMAFAVLCTAFLGGGVAYAHTDSSTGSITLATQTEHDLVAYQVFAGDIASDGSLAGITWGSDIDADNPTFLEDLHAVVIDGERVFANVSSARDLAEILDISVLCEEEHGAPDAEPNDSLNSSYTEAVVGVAMNHLTQGTAFDGRTAGSCASNLDDGWYIVTSLHEDDDETKTLLFPTLIAVDGGETRITPKEPAPLLEKYVQENSTHTWGKVADAETGEWLVYRLDITLPKLIDKHANIGARVIDTLSENMTVDMDSISVACDEKNLAEYFTASLDDNVLTLECTALENANLEDGGIITVSYMARLESGSPVGEGGSINTAWLEFEVDGRRVKTPPSKTATLTYQLNVRKVDAENHETTLEGAAFVLKRAGNIYAVANDGYIVSWTENYTEATRFVTGQGGSFSILGLDADEYTLVEVKAPVGYTLIPNDIPLAIDASISFDISAEQGRIESISLSSQDSSTNGSTNLGVVYATVEDAPAQATLTTPIQTRAGSTPKTGDQTAFAAPYLAGGLVFSGVGLAISKLVPRKTDKENTNVNV